MLIRKSRIPIKEIILIGLLPSSLKKLIYKIRGYSIGRNVTLAIGSVVIGDSVTIGEGSEFGFLSIVRGKEIKIGRFVKIGSTTIIDTEKIYIDDDAKINEQVFIGGLSGPDSVIKIGKRTIIMQMSFLNPYKPLTIGDDTGIGGHCLLFTHGSWSSQLDGYPVTFAPITLGKNVWLPWRVFVMPGVTIGDNVVIGANSLVAGSLPSNCLAAGSPAKIIKENYPTPPTDEKRTQMLDNMFNEFERYLQYHNYSVRKNRTNYGFEMIISSKSENYAVYYLNQDADISYDTTIKDRLLVFDFDDAITKLDMRNVMTINLREKTRFGTSKVGEEFVHFISRFGIRFARLD